MQCSMEKMSLLGNEEASLVDCSKRDTGDVLFNVDADYSQGCEQRYRRQRRLCDLACQLRNNECLDSRASDSISQHLN